MNVPCNVPFNIKTTARWHGEHWLSVYSGTYQSDILGSMWMVGSWSWRKNWQVKESEWLWDQHDQRVMVRHLGKSVFKTTDLWAVPSAVVRTYLGDEKLAHLVWSHKWYVYGAAWPQTGQNAHAEGHVNIKAIQWSNERRWSGLTNHVYSYMWMDRHNCAAYLGDMIEHLQVVLHKLVQLN